MDPVFLVVAKAPVPGQVKTRLCPPLNALQAARVAAAALLDTLDSVCRAAGVLGTRRPIVALAGDLRTCSDAARLRRSLDPLRRRRATRHRAR